MKPDCRLQGQERYLQGATLKFSRYMHYPESRDHDHCEFCGAKFTEAGSGSPDALHCGYCTPDRYRWICPDCFEDFRAWFAWTLET
jgi:hypothetical protein